MTSLLVAAGEASGDLHAARLLAELRRTRPDVEAFGLGGDELEAVGCNVLADSREVAVVGITEVLRVLPRARQVFHQLLAEADKRRPVLAVLVDFPDFNLRLARRLKAKGIPVVYYVSPQVWAWRRRRVEAIARDVDRMLVLFPFEVDFYRRHGVEVAHVGHPLVDEVPDLPSAWDQDPEPRAYRVALLPGSRRSEIEALLPAMVRAMRHLAAEMPIAVRLIEAPSAPAERVGELLAGSPVPIERVRSNRFAAIADSHVALCASGTATLEVGLLGTPLIVAYRLQGLSYLLARLLVDLPSFSLANLVLGRREVPELLQREVTPERLAAEAARLLRDGEARGRLRAALGELRGLLGDHGASARAAAEVAALLPPAKGAR